MIYTIENEFLTAQIKSMGAELHSIKDKADGEEYLWQGNTDIWYGQAPILFPFIGQLINDSYKYNGKTYEVKKHGFARKNEFECESCEGNCAVFVLKSNEEFFQIYPFDFELRVTYKLVGKKISVTHKVINHGENTMYFSIGAHPGFNCALGDTLEFDQKETLHTERIDSTNLLIPETFPVLDNESVITITKDSFVNDALILSGIKSDYINLIHKNSSKRIRFNLGKAPVLGIWAKPGAPYVCIEPWFGINDCKVPIDDVSKKREIRSLESKKEFTQLWEAEFIG